jgi:sodium transport system permease protein
LEPLLANPVYRWELVAGKLGATWLFSAVCLVEMIVGFGVVTHLVPTAALISLDIHQHVSLEIGWAMFMAMFPLTFCVAGLQMVIASFCHSFKEAQNYISMLMMVAMVPGMALSLLPFDEELWMMGVPILSEQLLVFDLLRGKGWTLQWLGLSSLSTTLFGLFMAWGAVRLYSGERFAVSTGH